MARRNYDEILKTGGVPIKTWTRGVAFEEAARRQLMAVARLPFIHSHIAAMPDVHLGRGATVGSVIATRGAIVPAAVGVDIGCGMVAQRTSLDANHLPDHLGELRSAIEAAVPHGGGGRGGRVGAWKEIPNRVSRAWRDLGEGYDQLTSVDKTIRHKRPVEQLGTLGSGNHFIEVCLDEQDQVWIMLHSGSRGPGNRIGIHYIARAQRVAQEEGHRLPDRDLAYLVEGTPGFEEYVGALDWAQNYARINRALMMANVVGAMQAELGVFSLEGHVVDCHHNYVARERHFGEKVFVTRKGALRAGKGELGIIPGSMGDRSYIVRGKGNPESFESCSHGAGRSMSRTQARKVFSMKEHAMATRGVECRRDKGVLDETPGAYKPIEDVMRAQRDLVEVVAELRQVVCVKG